MKILNFLCEKGICFYNKNHTCARKIKQDIYVREHDVDEFSFDENDDDFFGKEG